MSNSVISLVYEMWGVVGLVPLIGTVVPYETALNRLS